MSIIDKIKSNSTLKESAILNQSKFFTKKDMVQTSVPALNIALSGDLFGGLTPGHTMFAGESKRFKTLFALILVKAYMEKYPDAACILYDSEFGSPLAYFDALEIDQNRVLHCPFLDVEQLKFDLMAQLEKIERGDKVIILVDSLGMTASRKETEDALNEKSVADMTRAKAMKSLFRLITPRLMLKDIPMVSVNHIYQSQGMFPVDIVSGGKGSYLGSDNIFIIGRQQEKEGTEITGYNFIINVEKSRYVKEKSKIPVQVSFEKGVNKWSGLLDIAVEGKFVIKPKVGWYQKSLAYGDEKNYRADDTNTEAFWLPIINDEHFQNYVNETYQLADTKLLES